MTHIAGKMVRVLLLSTITVLLLAGFAVAAESEQAVAVGATTGSSLRLREEQGYCRRRAGQQHRRLV